MHDLKLAHDAVNRISEVAAMLQTTIDNKQAFLDGYAANPIPAHPAANEIFTSMLQMNIDELERIREHLLAP